ncbi:hypothetical protein EH31_11620 [Erythrobacter longus]|uniref:Uncharacterized protein n=1 Tax=Erythrobacter longus TaxID=1044 RepID=A0A074M8P4_ERYLO|nr:hypothetical protein [Erythrobacter longus]KEO89794.1 hypothetical protein EH31_11620 [Erythrobacter longus]
MDKYLLGAALAVPLLIVSGQSGSGAGPECTYTKPGLVFAKACIDDGCREKVRSLLPACKRQMAGKLSKTVRYEGGTKQAPYLSLAVMDDLASCMSRASFGSFSTSSLDLSDFSEVSKDVRGETMHKVGGGDTGSGLYMLPIVGETTMLYGPA